MSGIKYMTCTAVFMVAVLFSFIIVLGQFNLMVYPACISAFSLDIDEKGFCQIEFLGEKAYLPMPDFDLLNNWRVQSRRTFTYNLYQAMEGGGEAFMQIWNYQKNIFEEFRNAFAAGVLLPLEELLHMRE